MQSLRTGPKKLLTQFDRMMAESLGRRSTLFEAEDPLAAPDAVALIRRTSVLLAVRSKCWKLKNAIPKNLPDAIGVNGSVHFVAEPSLFGHWLCVEHAPGLATTPGKQHDARTTFKTLAAALAEISRRRFATEAAGRKPVSDSGKLTPTDLSRGWNWLFGETSTPSDFNARIKTLKRVLPAYLGYLRAGKMIIDGRCARESPRMAEVLKYINGGGVPATKSSSPISLSRPPAATTVPKPFTVALCYSSAQREEEFRLRPPGMLPVTKLKYVPEDLRPKPPATSLRPDRKGRIALVPEVEIRRDFTITALIDRIAILVETRDCTTRRKVKALLDASGLVSFVHERESKNDFAEDDWRHAVPELGQTTPSGQHYAILIQEPTPAVLEKCLNAIDQSLGIMGDVVPVLVELAVDFYPRRDVDTNAQLALREQMVGLLQRHHWCSHRLLLQGDPAVPSRIDARQVYAVKSANNATAAKAIKKTQVRYLFPHIKGTRIFSDAELSRPKVLERILCKMPTSELFLDASLYTGSRGAELQIRAEQKIGDKRNPSKKAQVKLNEAERRARIEVEFKGVNRLQALGLHVVSDLARMNFRALRTKTLMFRLSTVHPLQDDFDEAMDRVRLQGCYGFELVHRARRRAEWEAARGTGKLAGKLDDTEGASLVDWAAMNQAVGHAADQLQRRWKSFRWR